MIEHFIVQNDQLGQVNTISNVCRDIGAPKNVIYHSESNILRTLKTRLGLYYFSPAFNKYEFCRNVEQLRWNQNSPSGLSFVPMPLLQNTCLLNVGLELLRSDLVFEQSKLRNSFILECSILGVTLSIFVS